LRDHRLEARHRVRARGARDRGAHGPAWRQGTISSRKTGVSDGVATAIDDEFGNSAAAGIVANVS
jgi:hypothetical protein